MPKSGIKSARSARDGMVCRSPENESMAPPSPGERVWSMTKNEKRVDAELREHGEFGCEVQFLYEGELASGKLWPTRAAGLVAVEAKRQELEAKGWQCVGT